MSRAQNKSERLQEIESLLLAHSEGLTQAEIARHLDVHRSTIHRDLAEMRAPIYDEGRRFFIDRQAYLFNVRFTMNEAMAVHLASRLFACRMERKNPHAASALRKLGSALKALAPHVSAHLNRTADVMEDDAQHCCDPVYLQALERLTQAWAERRQVEVWHRNAESGEVKAYRFNTYFIEPNAIGQATYAIGWRQPPGELRTFKIERIVRVELSREQYEIPADFDPIEMLGSAWGIWFTDKEPVEVVLKFSRRAARRVRETRWHRSEQVDEQADGSLVWRARVAEPQEMMPWIRGWGADVVVLEPEKLRQTLGEEVQKMAKVYGCIEGGN